MQTTELDLERVQRLSSSWKAEAVVARAVCTAWSVFQLHDELPIAAWAHRYQPSRAQRRTLRLYPKTAHNYAAMALAELPIVPGIRAKTAYLRAMLSPDRGYLNARTTRHLQRWRHAASTMRNWHTDR